MRVDRHGLILCALVLSACAPADPGGDPTAANGAAYDADAPGIIRGRYTWGHEEGALQPCGSSDTARVTGDLHVLATLHEGAQALAAKRDHDQRHGPLYLEVRGAFDDRPDEGFASGYDRVLYVDHVELLTSTIPATCAGTPMDTATDAPAPTPALGAADALTPT